MSVMDELKDELRENAIAFTEAEDGSITVNDGLYDRPPLGAYTDEHLADLIRRRGVQIAVLSDGGVHAEECPVHDRGLTYPLRSGCTGANEGYGSGRCRACLCIGCCGPRQCDERGQCRECRCNRGWRNGQ